MDILLKSCVVYSILSILTYVILKGKIPDEKLDVISHWSLSSLFWIGIISKILPEDSNNIVWVGVIWPLLVGVGECATMIHGNLPRENRGSVQMDMGALLNIGFSLSTVSMIAKENGRTNDAKCITLLTSSVVILCLCFLMPSPALLRTNLIQKSAVAYATGMLIITASLNVSLKLNTLCDT